MKTQSWQQYNIITEQWMSQAYLLTKPDITKYIDGVKCETFPVSFPTHPHMHYINTLFVHVETIPQ